MCNNSIRLNKIHPVEQHFSALHSHASRDSRVFLLRNSAHPRQHLTTVIVGFGYDRRFHTKACREHFRQHNQIGRSATGYHLADILQIGSFVAPHYIRLNYSYFHLKISIIQMY